MVATILAAFSFAINVVYLMSGHWLARAAGVEAEDSDYDMSDGKITNTHRNEEGLPLAAPYDRDSDEAINEQHPPASHTNPLKSRAADASSILSEREAAEVVARKKHVILRDITKLGDVFWLFLVLNCALDFNSYSTDLKVSIPVMTPDVCGSIWAPFTSIAANLLQHRYGYNEADASATASFLHAGSIILYPLVRNNSSAPLLR